MRSKLIHLNELYEKIRALIDAIFTADKALEEATTDSYLKAQDALSLFVKVVKKVVPLKIKYSGASLGTVDDKQLVWHEEYGIAIEIRAKGSLPNQVQPLEVSEGDFSIERLVLLVHHQLESTLNTILSRQKPVFERTKRLEEFINMLEQWEKSDHS